MHRKTWSKEEKAYLAEIVPGRSHRDILALMNARFDSAFTLSQIKGALKRYRLNTGRTGRFEKGHVPQNKGKAWDDFMPLESQERSRATCFKPGDLPQNHREVGDERITKDGYTEVKTSLFRRDKANDCWEMKHRLAYEEHHGKIPEGHVVIFCDRDKRNFDIGNLMCIPQSVWATVKKLGLEYYDRDSAEAAVSTARLSSAINGRLCSERRCAGCGEVFKPYYAKQRRCRTCIDEGV